MPRAPRSIDRAHTGGRRLWLSAAALSVLAGCGDPATPQRAVVAPGLESIVVQPTRTPLERRLDGTIEAVNQGTVAAQTSGRVDAIFYDVNDFVPAGAVIVRLRATEQRAGLLLAQAGEREALARDTEAQTRS